MKVLFVCLGNICRSPMAETVFRHQVESIGRVNDFEIDSAGTAGYHQGELADARMRKHASQRGYNITSRSRKVVLADFEYYDKILAMDDSNVENLRQICPESYQYKISKITKYAKQHALDEVPDPYYGGAAGFELVIDLLEDACKQLLDSLQTEIS